MRANEIPISEARQGGVLDWLLERSIYELERIWACYWWVLRVHVAARHGIPRSCLEDPPAPWLKVLQGPTEKDR
ncbi:hypothetical protein [Phenylobacterium sp. Root700]|uniref:hypothetical protein n=1 Tax=Phenylobacterium sp. Root700 TaxID=1736591 RepID=UPI0006F6EE46|nr:hypothetical protein [Phenylobacterium sp. Root700]KRB42527.1 hypothetical protein ASE02_21610 [Phenylobacterium sp. Root700]